MIKKFAQQHKRLVTSASLAITSLLNPSGKIISGAVAGTVLIGGVTVQQITSTPLPENEPATVSSTHIPSSTAPYATILTSVETDGEELPVMLAMNLPANSSQGGTSFTSGSGVSSTGTPDGHTGGSGLPSFGQPGGVPSLSGPLPPPSTGSPNLPNSYLPPPDVLPPPEVIPPQFTNPIVCTEQQWLLDVCPAAPKSASPLPDVVADGESPDKQTKDTSSEAETPAPDEQAEQPDQATSVPEKSPDPAKGGEQPKSNTLPTKTVGAPGTPTSAPGEPDNSTPPPILISFLENIPTDVLDSFALPENEDETGQPDSGASPPGLKQPQLFSILPSSFAPESQLISPSAIPEPSVLGLVLLGLTAMVGGLRRRHPPTSKP